MFFSCPPTLISLLMAFAISTLDKFFHSNSLWCVVVYLCSPIPWWWSCLSSQPHMRWEAAPAVCLPSSHLSSFFVRKFIHKFCSAFMFPFATPQQPPAQHLLHQFSCHPKLSKFPGHKDVSMAPAPAFPLSLRTPCTCHQCSFPSHPPSFHC